MTHVEYKSKVCSILDTGYLALWTGNSIRYGGIKHKAWSIHEY